MRYSGSDQGAPLVMVKKKRGERRNEDILKKKRWEEGKKS